MLYFGSVESEIVGYRSDEEDREEAFRELQGLIFENARQRMGTVYEYTETDAPGHLRDDRETWKGKLIETVDDMVECSTCYEQRYGLCNYGFLISEDTNTSATWRIESWEDAQYDWYVDGCDNDTFDDMIEYCREHFGEDHPRSDPWNGL